MTYPPGQPEGQWQGQAPGGYSPGQPYQQAPYPQAPYPQQPAPSPGIAIAAMLLCTLTCLCVVSHSFRLPSWATVLNVVWAIGDIFLVVGTIFMWCRNVVGRIMAIVGLCLELAAVVSLELAAASMPDDPLVRPWTWLIDVFAVLGLAFVLLPGTGAYLKAGRARFTNSG